MTPAFHEGCSVKDEVGVALPQAQFGGEHIKAKPVWTASFYGYDGGGSVRQLTNSASTVTDSYEYDAFGNEFTVSGSTPNEFMYWGEQFDSDLGLYYLRARYYNPLTGRFMSRDPEDGHTWDPQSLHKYLYAKGDPVNGIDPLGRDDLVDYEFETNRFIAKTKLYYRSEYLACVDRLLALIEEGVEWPDMIPSAEWDILAEEAEQRCIAALDGYFSPF
jgi:RHS repeat-associated protein